MLKFLDKYLPLLTLAGAAIIGLWVKASNQQLQQEQYLQAILVLLLALITSEYLKRTRILESLNDKLSVIEQRVIPDVEPIANRESYYHQVREAIEKAHGEVRDTTWGAEPPPMTGPERAARDRYRHALCRAIERGVIYTEVYTVASSDRYDEITLATAEGRGPGTLRVLEGVSSHVPLIDFLVVDRQVVFLSRPHAQILGPGLTPYVRVSSANVANVFAEFFHDCWDAAHAVRLTKGQLEVVMADGGVRPLKRDYDRR